VVQVDETMYEDLDPENVDGFVDKLHAIAAEKKGEN